MGARLHPILMTKTAFHADTLARVGLTKSFSDYSSQPYCTDLEPEPASHLTQSAYMGLEYFTMLKSMKDVTAEYSNFEQLKRMRQAYIVHLLDVILSERSRVAANDRAIKAEEEAQQGIEIGLDNVFELAAKEEDDDDDKESSEEESEQEETHPEFLTSSDLVQPASDPSPTEDRRDQSLVRPKVLILAPFKQMAFQIIEQIIFLCNGGKWKRVSKKKKFRAEYDTEEEAFNDFFRIGLSFVNNKNTGKLQLKLYE